MSAGVGFTFFLVLTLAMLGSAVVTGFKAKRVWHVSFVASALASLAGAIWYALALGKLYDLETAGWITPVHMFIARATTVAYLLPILSGLRTIFRPVTRSTHRKLAYLALAMTVVTAITGTVMLALAQPHVHEFG